jgi:phosphoserine phosphatase RsbU/P
MAPQKHRFFYTLHEILTRDLTRQEFDKLFSNDTRGMYEFYARSMKSIEGEKRSVRRVIKFLWNFFVAFLMKLTPARRFLYAIAIVFFFIAIFEGKVESSLYAFFIVNFLLALEVADKLTTKDELAVAREIQEGLQPQTATSAPGYEMIAHSEPAREIGGDYHDILPLPTGETLVVVGDVSGKGISSALYVVKAQTALRLFVQELSDIRTLLVKLNHHICGQVKKNYFLTLAMVKLFPSGEVELCRAGHLPLLLWKQETNTIEWIKPNGMAIGLMAFANGNGNQEFERTLEVHSCQMKTGDLLVLYSDGITEATDRNGKEYGQNRLERFFQTFAAEPLTTLKQRLLNDVTLYRNGVELRDDLTFVLIRKT